MEARPKIFVSSTVYDFADLRSALKYWLTEMGFEVFMSEYPDFKKDSSGNSYDACLRAIEQCDYFILLIGSRVGGNYSSDPQISITQQEYRTAYQQFEKGIIKRLITFVREDIWTIKEDRKALHQYLKENYLMEKELSPEDAKKIESHDSTFVTDASFIFSFIDEVSKKIEMKAAVEGDSAFPLNNWINPFSSFEDIVNVLKAELRFHSALSYKQWAELVAQDLSNNLAELTQKKSGGTYCPLYLYAKKFRDKFPRRFGETFDVEYMDSRGAWVFLVRSLPRIQNLRTELLKSAIQSCAFLVYDSNKADYNASNVQKALSELVNIITNIQRLFETQNAARVTENFASICQLELKEKVRLNSVDITLCNLVALYDSQYNIIELSRYLFAVLKCDYDETKYPELLPTKIFDTDIDEDTFNDTAVSSDEMYRYMLGEE